MTAPETKRAAGRERDAKTPTRAQERAATPENPHQDAAMYEKPAAAAGLTQSEQLHGKEMSCNNYTDADAAYDFTDPAVAIIKHANPCGITIAFGADIADAHRKAHSCDPVSVFGGVTAANREVTVELAEQIAAISTEVVIAPSYEDEAVEVLQRKKNIRVLKAAAPNATGIELCPISGATLTAQLLRGEHAQSSGSVNADQGAGQWAYEAPRTGASLRRSRMKRIISCGG